MQVQVWFMTFDDISVCLIFPRGEKPDAKNKLFALSWQANKYFAGSWMWDSH